MCGGVMLLMLLLLSLTFAPGLVPPPIPMPPSPGFNGGLDTPPSPGVPAGPRVYNYSHNVSPLINHSYFNNSHNYHPSTVYHLTHHPPHFFSNLSSLNASLVRWEKKLPYPVISRLRHDVVVASTTANITLLKRVKERLLKAKKVYVWMRLNYTANVISFSLNKTLRVLKWAEAHMRNSTYKQQLHRDVERLEQLNNVYHNTLVGVVSRCRADFHSLDKQTCIDNVSVQEVKRLVNAAKRWKAEVIATIKHAKSVIAAYRHQCLQQHKC